MISLKSVPTHLLATGGILAFLIIAFLLFFLLPGLVHWFRLRNIQVRLRTIPDQAQPDDFRKVFARDRHLAHFWAEYRESLHTQREERDGQITVIATRSTIPAESYFNSQAVVDSRLRTEFFKHLPGIFTGLGIIGTFLGLIDGLRRFEVSENAGTVRASLESLMHSVGEAFLISAAAIIAAMVVTFLEKLLVASLYRRAEEIAHSIDARFDGGWGEEYLSRLVKASEDSASQAKILKDALVKDLGDLLRELTASQVEAAREDNRTLGETLAGSIKDGLKGPLENIAATVRSASGDQSAAAVQMLNDVMVSFSQRLNDLFGGQITGINELNKQTAQGMQDAVNSLNALVAKLEESGKKSTEDMALQMTAAVKAMEERQTAINAQTQAFVEQIRMLVENSQAETQEKLQSTLESIGQQMTTILASLGESQAKAFEANRAREQSMSERTENLVYEMTGGVEMVIKEMAGISKGMAESVSTLTTATSASIERMNAGADRLNAAAIRFADAGDRVGGIMEQAAAVGAKLTEVSGSLTTGAGAIQEVLRDYRAQRDAVGQLLAEIRATVELARKEASLTGDVLRRIENSAEKLGAAQKAADEYLDGVGEVLATSSEAFRESVVSTLGKVNHDFHTKLSSAVSLLSTAVQELEVTLGSLAPRR